VKEKVRADELRPRFRENQAYETGKLDASGRCVPIKPPKPSGNNSDDGSDEHDDRGPPEEPPGGTGDGLVGLPTVVYGWSDEESHTSDDGDDDDLFLDDPFADDPRNDPPRQEASKKAALRKSETTAVEPYGSGKPISMLAQARSSRYGTKSLKRKFQGAEDAYVGAANAAAAEVDDAGVPEPFIMWQQMDQETMKRFRAPIEARQKARKALNEDHWSNDVEIDQASDGNE
jgi:hypothetical protein